MNLRVGDHVEYECRPGSWLPRHERFADHGPSEYVCDAKIVRIVDGEIHCFCLPTTAYAFLWIFYHEEHLRRYEPACECGGTATNTTHSNWCPAYRAPYEEER